MPSCLPVNIIDAKFNVATIFPDRTGRADGRPGPYRPLIVTERIIIISTFKKVKNLCLPCGRQILSNAAGYRVGLHMRVNQRRTGEKSIWEYLISAASSFIY